MQPAGLVFRVAIAAQRPHGCPPVTIERSRKATAGIPIARTFEVDEPDPAYKAGSKFIFVLASHQQHSARGPCQVEQHRP